MDCKKSIFRIPKISLLKKNLTVKPGSALFLQGDGTFAKQDIPERTMISQYGGVRLLNNIILDEQFESKLLHI